MTHARRLDAGPAAARRRRTPTALLAAALLLAAVAAGLAHAPRAHADTTTVDTGLGADYNPATNAYTNQPDLTPDRVQGGFGQAWEFPTADQPGIAQVLARPVQADGTMIIATEDNVIYGLDPQTGAERWHVYLASDGTTTDPSDPNRSWYFDTSAPVVNDRTCGDISPHVGVTSTPTVGPDGTVYVVDKVGETPASVKAAGGDQTARFEMHAIDPTTGTEKTGWPVVLDGPADNAPSVTFAGAVENQRAALLQLNGTVYAAFASHCDLGLYRGWIIGVNTTTHAVAARFTTETGANHLPGANDDDDDDPSTPISPESGIWGGGAPLVPDPNGDGFWFTTGNGDYPGSAPGDTGYPNGLATKGNAYAGAVPATKMELGNAVVHASVTAGGKLSVEDFYIPNWAHELNQFDVDLGSGGTTLLPDDMGTTAYPHLAVAAGKSGDIWLLDRDQLNGFKSGQCIKSTTVTGECSSDSNAGGALSRLNVTGGVVFGKIAVYDGPGTDKYLYVRVGESMRAYAITPDSKGVPQLTQVGIDTGGGVALGGSPLVTQQGTTPGSGILWTEWEPNNDGTNSTLQAWSATPVNGKLVKIWEGSIGQAAKFQAPTVLGGWVYTAGRGGRVYAFHNPSEVPLTSVGGSAGIVVQGHTQQETLTLTARQAITVTGITLKGGASSPFALGTPTPALPVTLSAGQTVTVPYTFTAPLKADPQPGQVASSGLGYADVVQVQTDDTSQNGGEVDVPLSASAEYATGTLDANPLLALGDYAVSPSSQALSQSLVITNDGASNVVIDGVAMASGEDEDAPADPEFTYSGVPAKNATLTPQQQLAIGVSFQTGDLQAYVDHVIFTWHAVDAPSVSQTTNVEVTAEGVTPPLVTATPAPPAGAADDVVGEIDFGNVPLGSSATQTFVLTNTGGAVAVFSISKIPTDSSLTFPDPIPEGFDLSGNGGQVSIPITYTPTALKALDDNWTIDDGSGSGKQVLRITGNAVPAVVTVPPPVQTTAPAPGRGGSSVGTTPPVPEALPGLGSRGLWVWKGSVKRVNASTVQLGGLGSDAYRSALSTIAGSWGVTLPGAHDRLDVRFGTLTIRLQRSGNYVTATIYAGSRAVTSGKQRMSPGGKVALDVSISGGVARVSLQKHALRAEKAPASGGFGFYASGTKKVLVTGRGSAL